MKTNPSLLRVVLFLSLLFGLRAAAGAQSITLSAITPDILLSGPFTLTLTGTGFTPSCVTVFAPFGAVSPASNVTTTYVSPTQLTVSGNASAYYYGSYYYVSVTDATTQQTSNTFLLTVYPPPIAFSLYPNMAPAGSGPLGITAGNYDEAPHTLKWTFNGVTTVLTGTFYSPSNEGFYLPASLLTTPGIATVSSDGYISVPFYITGNASISSLSPNTASAGDASFTLTVNGAGFVSSDVVLWNGSPLLTTFVSATQLQAVVPASAVSRIGSAQITVNYSYPARFSVNTVHVSGVVSLEGETQPAQLITLEFRLSGGSVAGTITTPLAGDGSFNVAGIGSTTYTLAVKGYKWLRSVVPLTVGQTPVSNVQIALTGGDANGDNRVDSTDFSLLIGAFNSERDIPGSGYDVRADFNDDGNVDSTDFGILIGNFGDEGDK